MKFINALIVGLLVFGSFAVINAKLESISDRTNILIKALPPSIDQLAPALNAIEPGQGASEASDASK